MQTPPTLGKRVLRDFISPPGFERCDGSMLTRCIIAVEDKFVKAAEAAQSDDTMPWPAEQEIVAAEERTKKEVALVKQVADHIRKASQALYEMQATESCLPYHWAGEQVNTAPERFRMVHSPNYIRLGMLQGALRACDSLNFMLGKAEEELHHDSVKDRTMHWITRKRTQNFAAMYFTQAEPEEEEAGPARLEHQLRSNQAPPSTAKQP